MLSFPVFLSLILALSQAANAQSSSFPEGVIATGTMGVTNPPEPTAPTAINQTSDSRLLSVNSIDDFCIFAPPTLYNISDSETFEVAWCTKPRNNARVIQDGVLTGVSFSKTDFYVQVMGYGDFTKLNIPLGDYGGELDPHGATGAGNPIGGNVSSTITGAAEPFAEWMQYISYNQFCIRVCTSANATFSAAQMCWHELDEMGCEFVMPYDYQFNGTFKTCDADVAEPPGYYPTATVNGTPEYSSFAQAWTGTIDSVAYTVGTTVTPTAPAFIPSSSNCVTVSTISNGIPLSSLVTSGSVATPTVSGSASSGASAATGTTTTTGTSGSTAGSSSSAVHTSVWPGLAFVVTLAVGSAAALIF